MFNQSVNLAIYLLVGAVIGFVATKVAPKACLRFHQFSISTKSIWLHFASLILFGSICITALWTRDFVTAAVGGGLTALSAAALLVVTRHSKNPVHAVRD